jgi:hypothetical protein
MLDFLIPEPTDEDIARQEMIQIAELSQNTIDLYEARMQELYNMFWRWTSSIEAKLKVCWTWAMELFLESQKAQEYIQSCKPKNSDSTDRVMLWIPKEWEIHWGNDGSATATRIEEPIIPEEIPE